MQAAQRKYGSNTLVERKPQGNLPNKKKGGEIEGQNGDEVN